MRILAGESRGRALVTRAGRDTRPTDSRTRETLFNILGEMVPDARVLDLYAGSGAVGLEALSRGAKSCIFVEQNAAALACIRQNIRKLECGEQTQVWQSSVKSALARLTPGEKMQDNTGRHFDIIFADPPFYEPRLWEELENRMDRVRQLLHNGKELCQPSEAIAEGMLVIQHPRRKKLALEPLFSLWKERRVGDSMLSFFHVATE